MNYFSRLTDIVTCNLSQLLAEADDPRVAIEEIVREMEEGLAGAKRSVATARLSERRLQMEIEEHRKQADRWTDQAKQELSSGNENAARLALMRKREVEDLIAGLEQQHQAAVSTREHLITTQRALEARLSEARRKRQELVAGISSEPTAAPAATQADDRSLAAAEDSPQDEQIEAELQALKRQLGQAE